MLMLLFLNSCRLVLLQTIKEAKNDYIFWASFSGAWIMNYFENNFFLVDALVICIAFNTLAGFWLAIKTGEFEWKKSTKFAEKLFVYTIILLTADKLTSLKLISEYKFVDGFKYFVYLVLILAEAKKVFVKADKIYPNSVTKYVVKLFEMVEKSAGEKLLNNAKALNK